MHRPIMGRGTEKTDWEKLLECGETVIDDDFEDAASRWCEALESVPEEDFDTLYLRILDSMERSFVQQAWKTTSEMDFYGLDELAMVVRIYSPDTYELLPELITRIQKHIGDMLRFDYVSEMLDMALLFARTHFCVETYLDSFSEVCGSIVSFCDDVLSRKDAIYQYNKDEEYMEGFVAVAESMRAVFTALKNAIDMETSGLGYEEVLRIGFDWMDTDERPYVEKLQCIVDYGLEISDTDGGSHDMDTVDRLISDFTNTYLKRTGNNNIRYNLQA